MNKNLHPTRLDKIRDRLLGIESWAYKARHLPPEKEDELWRTLRLIGALYNEVWIMMNTPEDKGREWSWWE
jgi:hypothetical protein